MDISKFSEAIKPICSAILDLPPSCIEFVPDFPHWFVVGTYNLQQDVDTGSAPQSRTGSVNLFNIVGDELTLVQTLSHPSAILDLHFLPNDSSYFAIAASTGTISIYTFISGQISHLITHQAFDPTLLVLSFTWFPSPPLSHQRLMAATLSDGAVHLLQFNPTFTRLRPLSDGQAANSHDLEAWTCAFIPHREKDEILRIYSGGDDGFLRLVEMQPVVPLAEELEFNVTQLIPQNKFKGHEAGVTAILPLPVLNGKDNPRGLGDVLLTGSYDDHVRVYTMYDTRPGQKSNAKALAELNIGGGVWRLKFLDDLPVETDSGDGVVKFKVLASCMHAGARILEVKRDEAGEWSIGGLGSVTVHESMCYGSDVQPGGQPNGKRLCASTSFYDRLLSVWKFDSIHNQI